MANQSRAGPISMDPAGHEDAYRKKSVHRLHRLLRAYTKVVSLPAEQQSQALDRLHIELSKLTRPYGPQQIPLPKEVSVLDWRLRCVTAEEVDTTPMQIRNIAQLLSRFGAADSTFVQLLNEMTAGA